MATETPMVTIDQVEVWDQTLQLEFARLVAERQQWKLTEDGAKRSREDCDRSIEAMLLMVPLPLRVQVDQVVVQRVTSSSASKLDPKRLLELGVSATTIANATVEGRQYSYVLVKDAK